MAETRPRCFVCGDDYDALHEVGTEAPLGLPAGALVCGSCITNHLGLTGWSRRGGGWTDPLGHDEPIHEEGDRPADFQTIVAALEGRIPAAA